MSREKTEQWRAVCDFCGARFSGKEPPPEWIAWAGVDACEKCADRPVAFREVAKISAKSAAGAEDDCG